MAPTTKPSDTQINCLSVPNPSLIFSGDVSDSGSLRVGGKVVPARRKRLVRVDSDYVISNNTSGAPVKRTSEANALDGLPRKPRAIS